MGIFDVIKGKINLIGEKIRTSFKPETQEKIYQATVSIGSKLSHPILSIISPKVAKQKYESETPTKRAVSAGFNALAVFAPFTRAGASTIAKVAPPVLSFVKDRPYFSSTALLGTLVIPPLLKKSPKAREAIASFPSSLQSFGGNVGEFIEDPSLKNAFEIAKDDPLIVATLATAGLAIVGGKLVPLILGAKVLGATKENTEALQEGLKFTKTPNPSQGEGITIINQIPAIPQEGTVLEPRKKKKKKRAKAKHGKKKKKRAKKKTIKRRKTKKKKRKHGKRK